MGFKGDQGSARRRVGWWGLGWVSLHWYPKLDSLSSLESMFDIRTCSFDEMKYRQTSEECQPSGQEIAK